MRLVISNLLGVVDAAIQGNVFKYGNFSHVFGFQFMIIFTSGPTPSEIS